MIICCLVTLEHWMRRAGGAPMLGRAGPSIVFSPPSQWHWCSAGKEDGDWWELEMRKARLHDTNQELHRNNKLCPQGEVTF